MTSEVRTEAIFGLSGPDYPHVRILKDVGAIRIFEASEAAASTTSEVKTEARANL